MLACHLLRNQTLAVSPLAFDSPARQLLSMLTPGDLEKYKLTNQVGAKGKGNLVGIRNLEAGLNELERLTGIDLDGDGDIGVTNAKVEPSSGQPSQPVRANSSRPESERSTERSRRAAVRPTSAPRAIAPHTRSTEVDPARWQPPSARGMKDPDDGNPLGKRLVPGFSGFTPKKDPLGGSTFSTGTTTFVPTETEAQRLQFPVDRAWEDKDRFGRRPGKEGGAHFRLSDHRHARIEAKPVHKVRLPGSTAHDLYTA